MPEEEAGQQDMFGAPPPFANIFQPLTADLNARDGDQPMFWHGMVRPARRRGGTSASLGRSCPSNANMVQRTTVWTYLVVLVRILELFPKEPFILCSSILAMPLPPPNPVPLAVRTAPQ